MTKAEKKRWVRNFTKSVADDIIEGIADGRVPDNWDGNHLSELTAQKFDGASYVRGGVLMGPSGAREKVRRNRIKRLVQGVRINKNI